MEDNELPTPDQTDTELQVPILNDDHKLAYIPFHGLMINLDGKPATKPKTPIEKIFFSNREYVNWGDDNNWPGYVVDQAFEGPEIPMVIDFEANHMAAADLHYGFISGYEKDTAIIERFEHADIEDFWSKNNKQLFLQDGYRNLFWWHHAYLDLNLNPNKSLIASMAFQDTAHVRYAPQNEKTGNKDFVVIDANWPNNTKETSQTVRCIDPYHDWIGQMKEIPATRFIYPLFFNSPKRTYYQQTPWHSLINRKWLDLAKKIPLFKSKLMDNQMSIKYVAHVPQDYWEWRFKNWQKMNQAERDTARQEVVTEFNSVLTGVTNAGKTLLLTFKTDAYQKMYGKWEIQEMKMNLGEGAYIEDSQEVTEQILFAMCFDGTLVGKVPGKSQGAGSGSDKRLADEIFFKNRKPYAHKLCEALELFCQFNEITGPKGKKIRWFQPEQILTTLNNVTPANRP